jgi:hypothetical protein
VLALFRRILRLRPPGFAASGPSPSYEVACGCGHVLRGRRLAKRQILACPACGRKVFVLARSPLPPPEGGLAPPGSHSHAAWRWPIIAGAATLAILVVAFLAAAPFLGRSTPPIEEGPPDVQALKVAGRRALADGDSHLAVQTFQSILDNEQRHPELLAPQERQEVLQLYRQSDLLSRLSSRSVEEIVKEADLDRHDEEWKAHFNSDYKGKTVLFDDLVHFDHTPLGNGRRRPVLARYRAVAGGKEIRLALEDLTVLQALPLERGRRLLFGAKLSAVERGQGGQWVVRFDPESGVLLTDRGAAEAVCPPPLGDDLVEVLKRQEEWLRRPTP